MYSLLSKVGSHTRESARVISLLEFCGQLIFAAQSHKRMDTHTLRTCVVVLISWDAHCRKSSHTHTPSPPPSGQFASVNRNW